jgi:hypothetical protein
MRKKHFLSDEAQAIYDRYLNDTSYSAMNYGRGHIVWADGNLEDSHIQFCLGLAEDEACHGDAEVQWYDDEVIESLQELLKIPEERRFPVECPPSSTT